MSEENQSQVSSIDDRTSIDDNLSKFIKVSPLDGVRVLYVSRTIPVIDEELIDQFDPEVHNLDKKLTDDFWFLGKEQILKFCERKFGFSSQATLNKWVKDYALPVRKLPNGEVFLVYLEALNWAIAYSNLVRKAIRGMIDEHLGELAYKYGRIG